MSALVPRSSRGGAAILVYHSVTSEPHDPFHIAIDEERFAGHMEEIARRFHPLSLAELGAAVTAGNVPARSVVVTFDDGYANNLSAAKPVLDRYGIPATLFVTTGYVGGTREYWWDELARLVAEGTRDGLDPAEIKLDLPLVAAPADPAALLQLLRSQLVATDPETIDRALRRLHRWVGRPSPPEARASHRPLTLAELRELNSGPVFTLGAHTRHHSRLADQPAEHQRSEIAASRADLEGWFGVPPSQFAYPFGSRDADYSATTMEIVRESGFVWAVSAEAGLVTPSSPHLELPRYFVTARPRNDFALWLATRFQARPIRYLRRAGSRWRSVRAGHRRGG